MSNWYKSGRTRQVRLLLEITIGATINQVAGGSVAAGSAYTTLIDASSATGAWMGASSGFRCRMCYGTGSGIAALGVRVPSLTGNGFVPLVALAGGSGTASATVSITVERNLNLVELLGHTNNGERRDVYGDTDTCLETYTVHLPGGGDVVFTSGRGYVSGGISLGQFPPGQVAGWDMFGINAPDTAHGFVAFSRSVFGGFGPPGVAAEVTWSGGLVDADGNALYGDPSVPSNSGTGGSTQWGRVATKPPSTIGIVNNIAQATIQWMPTHAFRVRTEPRALPDGRPLLQQHRIEYELVSPIGGSGATSGSTLYSSGETVTFTCGGAKWLATLTGEGGFSTSFDAFLPVLSRVKVTHTDASRHYFAHIRAPFDGISLAQKIRITIPGTEGVSAPLGSTTVVAVGGQLGYRWLRVAARSVGGTGTLSVGVRLNGSMSDSAAGSMTTLAADTTTFLEIDLVALAGVVGTEAIELSQLRFTPTGHAFTILNVQAFIKEEALIMSCSRRRAMYAGSDPLDLPAAESTPWIECYTDGILSLRAPSFDGGSPVGWWSNSVRQLVAEINGEALPTYSGGWGPAEPLTFVQAAGSPPAPPALTGWSATLSSPPDGGKSYDPYAVYDSDVWQDGDVYTSALHGDGLIGGATLLAVLPGEDG